MSASLKVLNSSAFKRHAPYWLQRVARRRVLSSSAFEAYYRRTVDGEIDQLERRAAALPPPGVGVPAANSSKNDCTVSTKAIKNHSLSTLIRNYSPAPAGP